MKTLVPLLLLVVSLYATEENSAHADINHYFFGIDLDWCKLASDNNVSGALLGGVQINSKFGIGAEYLHVLNDNSHPYNSDPQAVQYDIFGVLVEGGFPLNPNNRIVVPLLIGGGESYFTSPAFQTTQDLAWFFTGDLGLGIEHAISDNFRIALIGGYRMAKSPTRRGFGESDINTAHVGITLKFGDFPS
jgi:hypothetical protein